MYDTEEEKPTKYHVKVKDVHGLCDMVDGPSSDPSPCKHGCTIGGLMPGERYRVIITAKNDGGSVDSDEVVVQTAGKQKVCGWQYCVVIIRKDIVIAFLREHVRKIPLAPQ